MERHVGAIAVHENTLPFAVPFWPEVSSHSAKPINSKMLYSTRAMMLCTNLLRCRWHAVS